MACLASTRRVAAGGSEAAVGAEALQMRMPVGAEDLRLHSPDAASVPARRVGCADGLCEAEPVASVFPIKTFPNHYTIVTGL